MKTILTMVFLTLLLYAQNIELNLKQFAELVSSQHLVNIIIDDSIQEENFTFFVQQDENKIMLPAFKKMLSLKKLNLIYDEKNNFYFIDGVKPLPEEVKALHTIKLDTLVYDDIKLILDQFTDIKSSYIKNSNTVMIICTEAQYKSLKDVIKNNDTIQEQFQLKITIVETNLKDVKERGTQINAYLQDTKSTNNNYFVNLLTSPQTATTNIFPSDFGFTASLKFLDTLGVSNIKSSPTLTVQSGKEIFFSAGQNIPYMTSNSTVNGASQSTAQQVMYKDVGLSVKLTPTLLNEVVFINLKFIMESLIDKSSLTPSTAKRELDNSFQLKKGQILVLSGLVQTDKSTSTVGVPILMKLPYLGQIFSYDLDSVIDTSVSIMIEII
ncbi:MAG: hypothetical protein WC656_11820 [Sulfurimonas sp.]|jgi:general secretion pathway protein D